MAGIGIKEWDKVWIINVSTIYHNPVFWYTAELDPVEQSWRETRKWLGIRYWVNKEELKEQLISAFEQGNVMVPIYDYLRT
jgi:hypothetical protein